jgi:hypothetical protein
MADNIAERNQPTQRHLAAYRDGRGVCYDDQVKACVSAQRSHSHCP